MQKIIADKIVHIKFTVIKLTIKIHGFIINISIIWEGACMRSCIYCGRELEKGEVCQCPQSVAYRQRKNNSSDTHRNTQKHKKSDKSYGGGNREETSYKTGYAGGDSFFERRRDRYRAKKAARAYSHTKTNGNFRGFWRYIIEVLKNPVDKIINPNYLSKAAIITIAAAQGALLRLCMFFVVHGSVGPFRFLSLIMNFDINGGLKIILSMLLAIVSGAISGVVLFLIYSGIFYLINRFIMRANTGYWDISVRLASTWIPFTVICVLGAVLSILSPITLIVLLICGIVSVIVLTYEALKTEWISRTPSKVMYSMMLGYFIFFIIVCHLLLI